MHGFSTVDGFMDVNDCVVEMIKSVANEPSVGLFYVQQHTQNAVPNLIRAKNRIVEKSNEVALHTADLEDSISMVRSLKDLGVPIADQMTKDIQKSLIMMSTLKVQKRTFLSSTTQGSDGNTLWGGLRMSRTESWSASVFGSSSVSAQGKGSSYWGSRYETSTSQPSQVTEDKGSSSYISAIMNSAKQKAAALRWPQRDSSGLSDLNADESSNSSDCVEANQPVLHATADELLVSSQMNEKLETCEHCKQGSNTNYLALRTHIHGTSEIIEDYEKLKYVHQAKLEEWLETDDDGLPNCENEETTLKAQVKCT